MHLICNQGVVGSNPTAGTNDINKLSCFFRLGRWVWLQMGYNNASLFPLFARSVSSFPIRRGRASGKKLKVSVAQRGALVLDRISFAIDLPLGAY